MIFKAINTKVLLSVLIVFAGIIFSYAVFAQGFNEAPSEEEISSSGISFPVPELGNCVNKDQCRKYCENPENMASCIAFAKRHGLMSEEEASRAEKFRVELKSGNTPGGCRGPVECERFCNNLTNMESCVAFAEKQGFVDKHLEEGKKILTYIKSGGGMPGGCNSKESCETYCSNFDHAEECFSFAERAGINVHEEADFRGNAPTKEQFKAFVELAKKGETPGGCRSKEQCELYCRGSDHFEECIAFGEKMGFVKPEEAELFRKTKGQGPGGCNSRESCEAYCNLPANQEMCFKFAEEHGFIKGEELERAKEGFVRLRQGLENAPPEVAGCLKSVVGANIIDDIQSGKLVPGPEIGERVKGCFEKHGAGGEANPGRVFDNAPPEVVACLKEKLGDDFEKVRKGESFPSPEMGDTFRVCFSQSQGFGEEGPEGSRGPQDEGSGSLQRAFDFVRTAPPGVQVCLKEKLGDQLEKIQSGELPPDPEIGTHIKSCFESFRPEIQNPQNSFPSSGETQDFPRESMRPEESRPFEGGPSSGVQGFPPAVINCVKSSLNPESLQFLLRGDRPGPEVEVLLRKCYESIQGILPKAMPMPPGEYQPPSPNTFPSPGTQYPQPLPSGDKYNLEYQKQYEEQYREQYPTGSGVYPPPPEGSYPSPESYSPPPSGGNLLEALRPLLFFFQ